MADVGSSGRRCEMKTHLWDSATVQLLLMAGCACVNTVSSYHMFLAQSVSMNDDFRMTVSLAICHTALCLPDTFSWLNTSSSTTVWRSSSSMCALRRRPDPVVSIWWSRRFTGILASCPFPTLMSIKIRFLQILHLVCLPTRSDITDDVSGDWYLLTGVCKKNENLLILRVIPTTRSTDNQNKCHFLYVKFHSVRCGFAVVIAQRLAVSVFLEQCTRNRQQVHAIYEVFAYSRSPAVWRFILRIGSSVLSLVRFFTLMSCTRLS